jgi:Na+-transporting NADH:ubiquinone oxidoreductase subunit C
MIGKLLALPNDDSRKIIFVAFSLCLICSLIVSGAAVYLRPLQEANAALDRKKIILEVAGLMAPGVIIEQRFAERIESRVVDLETGEFSDRFDPESYDQRAAARDPELSAPIAKADDIASIGRRAQYAPIYIVRDGNDLTQLIIPIHGYGLWSTMYGFLALESDLQTVAGIKFYDHGETPGLGGEIDNPTWQAKWVGKKIYDDSGAPRLRVIKGPVDASAADSEYRVDGISGSTLTGIGVTNMVEYWLGENGFREFLIRIQEHGV